MTRRLAFVLMSWDVVLASVGSRTTPVVSTLPSDAKVAWLVLLHDTRQVQVFFESEVNQPVPEGGMIPQFLPILTAAGS